jgi:hypothetical protein
MKFCGKMPSNEQIKLVTNGVRALEAKILESVKEQTDRPRGRGVGPL